MYIWDKLASTWAAHNARSRTHVGEPLAYGARALGVTARWWRRLARDLVQPYRPELHYMRGPGPKWREKHAGAPAIEARRHRPR